MKKIYVYVGQLRDWMLRIAKNVRKGLPSSMNSKVDCEIFRAAQDDKSQVTTGDVIEVNEMRISKAERRHSDDEGKSLNAHLSSLNSNGETLLVKAERYLWEKYEFRYNVLAKGYEYREASPPPSPKEREQPVVWSESPLLGRGKGEAAYFVCSTMSRNDTC